MDENPFRMVEGEGFKQFVRALEPRFILPARITAASDCFKLVELEKKKLRKFLKGRRLSLTTCWTSNQNLSYMALIAHFIDDMWDLQKKKLNFCLVDDHKGDTIGKTVESCLMEWG
ncbi:hypothetical protein LIER_40787 [Lithospermum erythrorhizon]|uniref:Transposase n=1 Tax=Lithospermum erythrorhizon TaxID=34254 RepID=A0AAV3R0S9_LITER